VSRIDHAVFYIHYIWMAPLQALLVFYFLCREVGLAASSGIALQLLFIPVLGKYVTSYITQRKVNGNAVSNRTLIDSQRIMSLASDLI
jgi:hypothetical protein